MTIRPLNVNSMTELNAIRNALMQERDAKKQLEHLVEAKTLELYEVNKALLDVNQELEHRIECRTYELKKSLLQQKLLAEISCSLNLLENFDAQISDALEKMGQHAGLDRIYIFETNLTDNSVVNKFTWSPYTTLDSENFTKAILTAIPCCKKLSSGKHIVAGHVSDLPNPCTNMFTEQGVKSILIIPLFVRNTYYGFIGFDTCFKYKDWDESEVHLLQTVSNLIAHAYEREINKQELIRAKEDAEAAAESKTEFLSTMSHEIRTPMNAVIGLSHLLIQDDPKPEQIDNLKTLKFASQSLLSLINDVLDINKIDAGKIRFEEINFDLNTFVDGLEHSFAIAANKKNIQFNINKTKDVPNNLVGDPTRLTQVLTNLIGNAIKFTDEGSVNLNIQTAGKPRKGFTQLKFEVSDTGIGIAANKLKSIFSPFSQATSETTRKFGGTGLGLSISQKLIELQNSQIQVESVLNEGTTFTFELTFEKSKTLQKATQPQPAPPTKPDLKGLRVLLVEDTNLNVTVATQFLTKWGVTTNIAENGQIAVREVQKQDYDLILMDLQMPVMDGFEATKAIRKLGGKYEELPIIALTASAELQIRERVYQVDMNDYVTKPFNPQQLYATIYKHTELNMAEQPNPN